MKPSAFDANRPPRVRRSELTTPAHSLKMAAGSAKAGADLVMLDLEDACAVSQKVAARDTLVEALNTLDWGDTVRAFRPNNLHTEYFLDDMLRVVGEAGANVDVIILPKTEEPREVAYVDQLLTHLERKHGLPVGRIGLEVLIESSRAVLQVERIAAASRRLEALIFGVADYAGDTGARLVPDVFTDFAYSRQKIVAAANAHGLDAVDCVTLRYKDLGQVRTDATLGRRMGFDGKWCIHPSHVPIVNEAFTPSKEDVDRARRIIQAYRDADVEKGLGAIVVGDEMVDRATIRVEERVLAIASRAGML